MFYLESNWKRCNILFHLRHGYTDSSEQFVMFTACFFSRWGLGRRFKLHAFSFHMMHYLYIPPLCWATCASDHMTTPDLFCWYSETFSKMLMRLQCSRPASLHYVDWWYILTSWLCRDGVHLQSDASLSSGCYLSFFLLFFPSLCCNAVDWSRKADFYGGSLNFLPFFFFFLH